MPLDPSIGLNANRPDGLTTLAQFIQLGRTKTALDRERETLGADIQRSKAESNRAQSEADVARETAAPRIASAKSTAETLATGAESARFSLTDTQAQKAKELVGQHINDPVFVAGTDKKAMHESIEETRDQMIEHGVPKYEATRRAAAIHNMIDTDPGSVRATMMRNLQGNLPAGGQIAAITPHGPMVSNEAGGAQINTNPLGGAMGAPVPGTGFVNVPGPQTPQVGPGGAPGILGAQPGNTPQAMAGNPAPAAMPVQGAPIGGPPMGQPVQGPIAAPVPVSAVPGGMQVAPAQQQRMDEQALSMRFSEAMDPKRSKEERAAAWKEAIGMRAQMERSGTLGGAPLNPGPAAPMRPGQVGPVGLAPGQAETIAQPARIMNEDTVSNAALAKDAPSQILSLQNIKTHVAGANLGNGSVADVKRAASETLNSLFGTSDAKTQSDLLTKEAARLAAGGHSDAADHLRSMGNPNVHMTLPAVRQVVDEIIGIKKMDLAKNNYMSQFATDPAVYNQKLREWNSNVTSRAFELAEKTPAEQKTFMGELKKKNQQAYDDTLARLRKMDQMGLAP